MSDKEYNSQISSFRAPVERLVAHFKNWKMLHTDYRRPYATYHDAFDAARALFFFSLCRAGYRGCADRKVCPGFKTAAFRSVRAVT